MPPFAPISKSLHSKDGSTACLPNADRITLSFSKASCAKSQFFSMPIPFFFILCVNPTAISLSHFLRIRSALIWIVTSLPSIRKISANSTATVPPPIMCSRLGIAFILKISSLMTASPIPLSMGAAPVQMRIFLAS